MKIIQNFIPSNQVKQRPGFFMIPQFITVHNTANSSKGANAELHSRYLHNGAGGRTVGWHFTVDDKEVYQHIPTNESAYHAGDGSGSGNRKSIGIEICENSDGDFQKAVKNAQQLIKQLMKEHNIPIERVVPHKHWSGKNCPHLLLNMWSTFIDGIEGKTVEAPKQKVESETATKYNGGSVVDYMNKKGMDSSFGNRKKLAKKYGIKNYKGTANQNIELLNKLKNGVPNKPMFKLPDAVYRAKRPYPKGSGVKAVQQALSSVYYYPNKGAKNNGVDGIYGPNTADAVKRFQSMHGLKQDGVYGPKTKKALEKAMK